ncbi:hypothetical protein [Brevibacillus choshinensis]|uniref:hypothetical protein n=1 Tax=Brevibacillus choshinensis TaxID=54911 RepID=UPI002E1C2755|nr:hypothetical protein [Brevibacillus choshinensis]
MSDTGLDKALMYLKFFDVGQWIYPGLMSRKTGVEIKHIYSLLDILVDEGLLIINYESYCHICGKFDIEIYETFASIPHEHKCEHCESTLTPLDNSIVIYKVINNEL